VAKPDALKLYPGIGTVSSEGGVQMNESGRAMLERFQQVMQAILFGFLIAEESFTTCSSPFQAY